MTLTPEHFPHIDRQRERFMELLASFRPDEQQRLRDALDFAEREHTGQFRRGRILVPFIIHPIRVTCTLVDELGLRDVDALVAALLHDVAEDCGISVASIGEHFGKEVQTLVRWLTWEEGTDMKWEQAKRMLRAPHLARLIKTSDIIDNSRSMWRVDQRGEVLRLLYGYEHWGGPIVASIGDHAQWLHQDALRRSAAYHFSNEREPSIEPNAGKELERSSNDKRFVRYPIHTHVIEKDDDLVDLVHKYATQYLRTGDVLAISERVVAITQGRAYRIEDINPSWLARLLVRFVTRNPAGIGLASPWTMELALREAGAVRMLVAAAVAAITKPFGVRGLFYRVAGHGVNAIDGPCDYTLPPYNRCATLGPEDPNGTAEWLARRIGVGVAIIDANDLGVEVLGVSEGVYRKGIRELFRDNPLGQSSEQTPMAIVRIAQG